MHLIYFSLFYYFPRRQAHDSEMIMHNGIYKVHCYRNKTTNDLIILKRTSGIFVWDTYLRRTKIKLGTVDRQLNLVHNGIVPISVGRGNKEKLDI